MRSRNTRTNVTVNIPSNTVESNKNRIEKNPALISLISTIVTAIALFLAYRQYYQSENHRIEDKIEQRHKDKSQDSVLVEQKLADSIWRTKQLQLSDSQINALKNQADNAHNIYIDQAQANRRQNRINQAQLEAIKSQAVSSEKQAAILQKQLAHLQKQYDELQYQNRAIFIINNMRVIKINSVKSTFSIHVSNIGVQKAKIDSVRLVYFNEMDVSCKNLFILPNSIDGVNAGFHSSDLEIWNSCINDDTIFLLKVYYKDQSASKQKEYPVFFKYQYKSNVESIITWPRSWVHESFYDYLKKLNISPDEI